jgi:hypothetical protein
MLKSHAASMSKRCALHLTLALKRTDDIMSMISANQRGATRT